MADRTTVSVLGAGLIAEAVAAGAGVTPRVAGPDERLPAGPVVVTADGWVPLVTDELRRRASGPVLPVRAELDRLVIGPWEVAGERGCARCAERRRGLANPTQRGESEVRNRHAARLAEPSPLLTREAATVAAALVADDLRAHAEGRVPRSRAAIVKVDLRELTVTVHRMLPYPRCEVCGPEWVDEPDHALADRRVIPTHRPGSPRGRDLVAELDALVDTYVDPRTGIVRKLADHTLGGQIVTVAELAGSVGERNGYGRAPQRRASRTTALLEALERFSAVPGDRRSVTVGSYHDLADRALDPRTLGLHPAEAYAEPDVVFEPFDPDRAYRWTWGWSFLRQSPLLVPETLAYYGNYPHGPDGHGFVYEISNGCALGSSLEEAVLYGTLEVAERDAFLLAWYARLPLPEMDLGTLDVEAALQVASLRAETGYRIRLFDMTAEQGIPAVWALATAPAGSAGAALVCTAGAHVSGERATRAALAELGGTLIGAVRQSADPDVLARAARMVDDPSAVREMEDHQVLYYDPRAASRLSFLTGRTPTRGLGAVGVDTGDFDHDDIGALTRAVVDRYVRLGMDVVVFDQTPEELRHTGLHAAKVLVPGTLSMTFGHRYRRTDLPRLREARRRWGLTDKLLADADINPHPHPFP
ncbi:TOMM precursor leader peptide-binding protein [Micromonospora sp. DT46]|uniref:TOMM precursor leader peptide-binding protein n=1 Tax=unclassified Micromonospora TaxID=2617518 RepID=UPI0033FCCEB4